MAPSIASAGPSGPSVILGSDGLPAEVEGQRVYRVTDQAEWQDLSGSFLLAAHIPGWPGSASCIVAQGTPENDLLAGGLCGGWSLGSTTGSGSDQASFLYAAPKSQVQLYGWANHAVVLRVHTHDTEAAQCSAAKRAACEAAVVVEAVVWPTVPSEINGERVYRETDLRLDPGGTLQNLKGSFLLGGVVSLVRPYLAPAASPGACVTAVVGRQALSQLLSDCSPRYVSIDSEPIAPKSNFDAVDGQVVVVRAHMNDPLAAQCPADVRTTCQEAIVVESVVWSSNPYPPTPPAPPTPAVAAPTPTSNPPSIP
jgi:hypothetical protein